MEIGFSIILFFYLGLLVRLRMAWDAIPVPDPEVPASSLPAISVVIAVRNEEQNVPMLIRSLEKQHYPAEKFEVVIVDDHSQDRTAAVLAREASRTSLDLSWFTLQEDPGFKGSHKKRALTHAIRRAKNPVIMSTDGDCLFHKHWLTTVGSHLQRHHWVLVSGPVVYNTRGRWGNALDIELAALIATGAASLHLGFPNMCNGANLAFFAHAFQEVNGYQGFEQVISGDDEFLLYKIHEKYPGRVGFLKHSHGIVTTDPPRSWAAFVNQRKRWAGKWKHHRSSTTRVLAVFIFLVHLTFILALIATFMGIYSWEVFLVQTALKICAEYLFVHPVLRFMDRRPPGYWYLGMQLLYSIYTLYFGVASNLGGYTWKNRRYP